MVLLMKYLMVYLLATVKFMFSFPLAASYKFTLIETFAFTSLGGISGVLFFALLTKPILAFWRRIKPKRKKPRKKTVKKINYTRNRRIVKLKNSYGFAGLIILTPCLLSIPVGTFIVVRYFGARFKIVFLLSITVIVYSIFLTFLSRYFEEEIIQPVISYFF